MGGHPSGSVVMGFTDMALGADEKVLTVVELLSGVFMVTLTEDQVNFSEDTAEVAVGGVETDRGFSSATEEF